MDAVETTEIGAFTAAVASDSVTPSGGACAAVAAAMGAALGEMGRRHISDDVEPDSRRTALAAQRDHLLGLADQDAAAVDAVLAARRGDDPAAVASARRRATEVPLEIATAALDVLEAAAAILDAGPSPATADVRTGAYLAHAAVRAAVETVRTNLSRIADEDYVTEIETTAAQVTADAEAALASVTTDTTDE